MKKTISFILILCTLLVLGACSSGNDFKSTPISQQNIDNAYKFVDLLEVDDFETAVTLFDEKMKNLLPADKLEETWVSLNKQVGAFEKKLELQTEVQSEHEIAHVISQFEKAKVDIKIVFDKNGLISGLWFQAVK